MQPSFSFLYAKSCLFGTLICFSSGISSIFCGTLFTFVCQELLCSFALLVVAPRQVKVVTEKKNIYMLNLNLRMWSYYFKAPGTNIRQQVACALISQSVRARCTAVSMALNSSRPQKNETKHILVCAAVKHLALVSAVRRTSVSLLP